MRFFNAQLAIPLAALLLLVLPAFGQLTSGNISGTVFDPTGATVPNADVVAARDATGVENTTHTTSAGDYRFENLPVGRYTIVVTAPGFNKAELKNVNVDLNVTITANVNLAIGQS
ncbi:MAG: carboxypeptidase regulatory-like domain-containing protein, partial [Acidobacteriaceae bacterium]|nr:carboxypeptidase regulatory-like domain-containing protein [Acidobacteriaceae bacterium]